MSKITIDNKKPDFDITQGKENFEKKGYHVPANEQEFREIMAKKNISVIFISNEIKNVMNWDDDELDEECPDRASKIDKFLGIYNVIYPGNGEKTEETPKTESEESANVYEGLDTEQLTLDEARKFLDANHSKLKKDVNGLIKVKTPPTIYENKAVTANSDFRIQYELENISRSNVLILNDELTVVLAVGKTVKREGRDIITIEKDSIDYDGFKNKVQFNIALLKAENETLTGEIIYKPITLRMQAMKETDRVLCIDFGTSNTTAGSYRIKDEFGYDP